MFERFTDRARRVVVLSQEQARELRHHHIGTEHVLLGVIAERDSVAAQILREAGLDLAAARRAVLDAVPSGTTAPSGNMPFAPAAKKTLERSLQVALQLRHDFIGPEHILLSLLALPDDDTAAGVLRPVGTAEDLRTLVLERWRSTGALEQGPTSGRAGGSGSTASPSERGPFSPAVGAAMLAARDLAGERWPIGTHHLLAAILADEDAAATRAVHASGIDPRTLRDSLLAQDPTGTSDESPIEVAARSLWIMARGQSVTIEVSDTALSRALALVDAQLPRDLDARRRFLQDNPQLAQRWAALYQELIRLASMAQTSQPTPPDEDEGPSISRGE